MAVATELDRLISIHAPAKGATHSMQIDCRDRENFNPRSREWSDGIY